MQDHTLANCILQKQVWMTVCSMLRVSAWLHLLSSLVHACLSLVSSSMACLLVLLLGISSSPYCPVLVLRAQPNDSPQGQLLPVLLLQSTNRFETRVCNSRNSIDPDAGVPTGQNHSLQ